MPLFNKKIYLTKTQDYCNTKEPKLTVIFIHGIASDSSTFNHALQYLAGTASLKDVRFVAFDLLGSGQSPKGDQFNYTYSEQLEALHNSIEKLKITTPLVLVGHSMGTFIVTRYANTYKKSVQQLILISPPVYTEENLTDPTFAQALQVFKQTVAAKSPSILQEKSFQASMHKIVMNKYNYKNLVELKTPATLIYGKDDQFIASFNYPALLAANPKYLTVIATEGRHGVSRDKYTKIVSILEGILHA